VWNEALRFNAVDPSTCNDLVITVSDYQICRAASSDLSWLYSQEGQPQD
jgi:hypothetical protein